MFIKTLEESLEAGRNAVFAQQMSRYTRSLFPFYGIKTPLREAILKQVVQTCGLPVLDDLPALMSIMWDKPEREWHYCALDIFHQHIKKCDESALDLVEKMICQNSWWDTVDYLAPKLAGKLFLRFPEKTVSYTHRWIESDNHWLQRSAIIFQLSYKTKTDFPLLCAYIDLRKGSKEFFIQKAIGWALRQYGRTAPEKVRAFVSVIPLAPLSKREAMKHL